MKNVLLLCIVIVGFMSCKSKSEEKPSNNAEPISMDHTAIKKIDAHAHYRSSREYLPGLFDKWNMQSILVDVAKEDSASTSRSWDPYLAHSKKHPDLFFLCSSLLGTGIDSPNFAQENIKRLDKEIEEGARMVKVWKNFGMVTKDASGSFIQIDDVRLQPIWDFLKEKGIPVMAHIGEPVQAWRPLDNPNNPHYGYYTNNPQYHAFKLPEIPSYETIIAARDNWIENNPDLKIFCAHLGSMSHDVDMVAERLDKFPNMYAETAARFGDLASQDSKKVAAFFEKYQDRLMFGSDYGNSKMEDKMTEEELKNEEENLNANYDNLWNYLSSSDSMILRKQKTKGLGLSTQILNKVYHQNITDLLKLE
jgi:predicted TIM-barrel fold metal-dependent hydrolase